VAGTETHSDGLSGRAERARAYRVFFDALDYQAGQREPFLERECQGDAALRAEVDALLSMAARDEAVTAALLSPSSADREDLSGREFGHFRLTGRIGEGGMGVVYRAERVDGVQQSVAIKVLSAAVGQDGQARFEREARLLAQVEHPAVARLVDAGVEQGRAWIAMEFVNGLRIDDYCAAKHLTTDAVVALLAQIAAAIAVAHRMLVVHNDIKPANVLVTPEGTPKLIDFGISRTLERAGTDGPGSPATLSVARLFSPGFAAPEQISGGPVTVATDVFGLGALGYRLLTGRSTFADAGEPLAYMLAISQRDIELPSRAAAKAGNLAAARQLRGDLDAILCKALQREPASRYGSAIEMRDDLQRYLQGRPVKARAATSFYRLAKFVRRNKLAVGLTALLCASLAAAGTFLALQNHRTARAREMAARRAEFIENLLASNDPTTGQPRATVAALLDAATHDLDNKLGGEPLVEASMLGVIAQTNSSLGRYAEGLAASDHELNLLRTHGGGPLEVGRALWIRGELLRDLGKWPEALPPLQEAVALLRPLHVPQKLCNALDSLGVVLAQTQQESAADAVFHEEIAIESSDDATLRPLRAYPYFGLSVMMGELGRHAESAAYGRQALTVARQTLPAGHPDLLNFETAYATSLIGINQRAAAEPLLREVIAAQTRLLGADNKATLLTRLALVDVLVHTQREAQAAADALPVARALESLLGADNSYTLSAWNQYGGASCNSHHEEQGLEALRRVEAGRRRTYPAGSWPIESTALSIGQCLAHARKFAEAETTLLAAVAGLEAARGSSFNRTQDGYRALRDLYLTLDRPDEAARWSHKVLN
jgi:eukaryotic-like serine/threonine-protein kinase